MLDRKTKAAIRTLIFPYQFKPDLTDNAVVEAAVAVIARDPDPASYLIAIRSALESDDPLSDIVEEPPSGSAIREFLAAVRGRLEKTDH